jgi:hypothetical protein
VGLWVGYGGSLGSPRPEQITCARGDCYLLAWVYSVGDKESECWGSPSGKRWITLFSMGVSGCHSGA